MTEEDRQTAEIVCWLIGDGRLLGEGRAIVRGYCERLLAAGVPLSRARIGQRVANPLLAAWGVIWTAEETSLYTIRQSKLSTGAWHGSPFQIVLETRQSLRKRLTDLDPDKDHSAYLEQAASGGTDFFATFLDYGDGASQGCSFVSNAEDGFADEHLALIEATRVALAAALEPVAMRRSSESLLRTYLGDGPARAVVDGTIRRGEHTNLEAVILFSDLRGFTAKSVDWRETDLLAALDDYFEAVVDAVRDQGGDILKFLGDGVLSIFPISNAAETARVVNGAIKAARDALDGLEAVNSRRAESGLEPLAIGIGLNLGPVTYGNVGSPDRLDFTVVGPAVNLAARVQDLCKVFDQPLLMTAQVANLANHPTKPLGTSEVRGWSEPVEIFAMGS